MRERVRATLSLHDKTQSSLCVDGFKQVDSGMSLLASLHVGQIYTKHNRSDSLTEWGRIEYPLRSSYKNPKQVYEPPLSQPLTTSNITTSSELTTQSFQVPNSDWDSQDLILAEMGYAQDRSFGDMSTNCEVNIADYNPPSFSTPSLRHASLELFNQFEGHNFYPVRPHDGSTSTM